MINIQKIEVDVAGRGHITNCFLIYDEDKKAVLIDPGYDEEKIINKINELELKVEYIIITHAHGDHIGALEKVQKFTNAKILIHKNEMESLMFKVENYSEMLGVKEQNIDENTILNVQNGENFKVGEMNFEVLHTPGHTSGCICIYEKTSNNLFTGDTIFAEGHGRCDLLSSDFDKMVESLSKIIQTFNDETIIYPGHDRSSNLKQAKRYVKMLLAMKGIKL